jgi:DHA1 family multidrug resistance protein-like MFS transporter
MFDLALHPTNPIRRSPTANTFRLSKDRGLPPSLEGDHNDYLVELV